MIHIYTDASFNDKTDGYSLIGGIGIVIIHFDEYDNIVKEELYSKRLTKNDILDLMSFKCDKFSLTNCMVEFIAMLDSFNNISVNEEEIHIFSDWDVISTLIEEESKCKRIFKNNPNIKDLFLDFKHSSIYVNNAIFAHHVKGHKISYYNIMADILATYWLTPDEAVNESMKCYTLDEIKNLKMNIAFKRRRIMKK